MNHFFKAVYARTFLHSFRIIFLLLSVPVDLFFYYTQLAIFNKLLHTDKEGKIIKLVCSYKISTVQAHMRGCVKFNYKMDKVLLVMDFRVFEFCLFFYTSKWVWLCGKLGYKMGMILPSIA